MRSILVVVVVVLGAVIGEDGGGAGGSLAVVARALDRCGGWSELGTCLRLRAVGLLDRALHGGPLVLNDYLTLAPMEQPHNTTAPKSATPVPEAELEAALPTDPDQKDAALDEMIADKISRFISSRSLRFNLPSAEVAEGRKKAGGGGKKGGGMMGMALMGVAGMMIQLAMAKIALIAGKALIVGKMALLLSAIIGLKKLVGGGGGGESHQVVYATEAHGTGGGHGGGWGRSAQDLAYSAQARSTK